jgi:hypothetical protein
MRQGAARGERGEGMGISCLNATTQKDDALRHPEARPR